MMMGMIMIMMMVIVMATMTMIMPRRCLQLKTVACKISRNKYCPRTIDMIITIMMMVTMNVAFLPPSPCYTAERHLRAHSIQHFIKSSDTTMHIQWATAKTQTRPTGTKATQIHWTAHECDIAKVSVGKNISCICI